MTRAQLTFGDHRLDLIGQRQKPHRIGDVAAAFAERAAELFLRVTEFLDEPAIALAFFDRVEVLALDVLDQRDLGRAAIVHLADDHRNLVQLRRLRCTPAPLAGENLVASRIRRIAAHEDRLQNAFLAHRLGQGFEILGIEMPPRLEPARLHLLDRQRAQIVLFLLRRRRFVIAEERRQTAAEAACTRARAARRLIAHGVTGLCNRPRSRFNTSLARWT